MEDNIEKIQDLLKKYNLDLWFIVNKDNNDPIFYKYISKHLYTKSVLILLQNRAFIIVSKMDEPNINTIDVKKSRVEVYTYNNEEELDDIIEGIICKINYVSKISLSYSTMGDKDADIILNSDLKKYKGLLRRIYTKYHKNVYFNSAEKVIYQLISSNSDLKLSRIKLAAKITDEILDKTFKDIYINMTEKEIAIQVLNKMDEVSKQYVGKDIVSIDVAWENCPFVLTGENMALNGHTLPSDKMLKRGDTINIDFGIKLVFSDGKRVYSDMQRMGYAAYKGENDAPKEIKEMFKTLTDGIEECLDYMKQDVKGYVVDSKLRDIIYKKGYTLYSHASGHPVGTRVHAIGTIIGSRLEPRSKIPFTLGGVYTLEPRIPISNGVSIEEMIIVTKFGGIPAYKFQKDLYIIK